MVLFACFLNLSLRTMDPASLESPPPALLYRRPPLLRGSDFGSESWSFDNSSKTSAWVLRKQSNASSVEEIRPAPTSAPVTVLATLYAVCARFALDRVYATTSPPCSGCRARARPTGRRRASTPSRLRWRTPGTAWTHSLAPGGRV